MTNEKSGIQQKDFFKYFSGKKMAYAYKLNKITKFNAPRKLKYYGITHPPQSFQFLK
jgi:predicted transcriptional regulator